MNTVLTKIKSFFANLARPITNRRPCLLPQGMTTFEAWASDIISQSNLPDNDSVRFALCTMVLHLPTTQDSPSKLYFIKALRKAAANQVVSEAINGFKAKQIAASESAKQQPVATVTSLATNGPKQ